MNRVASLTAAERNELFTLTAERCGIGSVAVIEKDFWVCWTLKQLFKHPRLSKLLIFKGGTSLSKVFGLIERFSEDIDLILDWRVVTTDDPTSKRSTTKQNRLNNEINKKACNYICDVMVTLIDEALGLYCVVEVLSDEKDFGHIVRVKYPATADSGTLLPYIQLEIGPLASWLPHSEYTIRPYAAESFPTQFDDACCPVCAIDAERTFWEKATILHHEAHRPETTPVPARYSRHYYDLYMMASNDTIKQIALDNLELLRSVVEFKKKFYPRGWANYDLAVPGSLRLIPPEWVVNAIRKDYVSMQEMIFGKCPSFDDIFVGLKALEDEINSITASRPLN